MRCKYIRKIFQNEENGYTVALFSTLDHEEIGRASCRERV